MFRRTEKATKQFARVLAERFCGELVIVDVSRPLLGAKERTRYRVCGRMAPCCNYDLWVFEKGVEATLSGFRLPVDIAMSFCRPNMAMGTVDLMESVSGAYNIDVFNSITCLDTFATLRFLESDAVRQLVAELRLCKTEFLYLVTEAVTLTQMNHDIDLMQSRCHAVVKFVGECFQEQQRRSDVILPQEFRALAQFIPEWVIGDDVRRQEFLASVSHEVRNHFRTTVLPLRERIELWCAEKRKAQPVPEAVLILDSLLEAFAEIQ